MNTTQNFAIEKCALESHTGLLTFPEVLGQLIELSVESYFADYRNQSATYYLSGNETIQVQMEVPRITIPSIFNKEEVVLAIRGAQNNSVRYPEFLKLTMSAGCIGYMVWITGRQVSYWGRQGEVHMEYFPNE